MRIGHIAMYTTDLEAAKEFFCFYFGAKANNGYHNRVTGFRSYFLTFEEGTSLEIMTRPDMVEERKHQTRTGYAHIAFCLGSKEAVDAMTDRLRNDGFEIISGPRTTGDGYYESCFLDLEGNQIEITI